MGDPIVTLEDVEFGYTSETTVLHGVDLAIERGEFVAIIGQNGSGKSTLVKQFNGLLEPDRGRAVVHETPNAGLDTRHNSMKTLADVVGYVFQNPDDQIFHTTIYEEIAYGLTNCGVPESEHDERIERVLDAVGLAGRTWDNPFSLGVGERQRLAIASVIAMEPELICVDEPTTGQDPTEARQIMDILKGYNNRGHTVVTITHDMALVANYTDRVVVIGDGEVIADGPPEEVFLREEHLERTNVRPPQIAQLASVLRERATDTTLDEMWLSVDDARDALLPDDTDEQRATERSDRSIQTNGK